MTAQEIGRALDQERSWHTLNYKGGTLALCDCGYLLRGVTKQTVHGRHEWHVKECLTILKERLEGR